MSGSLEARYTSVTEAAAAGDDEAVSTLVAEAGGCDESTRVAVWALCLGVDLEACPTDADVDATGLERDSLRMDLNLLLEECGHDTSEASATAIETTVILLCREHRLPYLPEVLDVLGPLLSFFATLSPSQVFALTSPLLNRFIPFLQATSSEDSPKKKPTTTTPQPPGLEAYTLLVRLMLQYHDCELCMFLDTHKIDAGTVVLGWVRGLFTSVIGRGEAAKVWDVLVTAGDTLMPTFLALALLKTNREHILGSAAKADQTDNEAVLESIHASIGSATISSDRTTTTPTSTRALFTLARRLKKETPPSAADDLMYLLSHPSGVVVEGSRISSILESSKKAMVLPIQTEELVEAFKKRDHAPGHLKFMVLDCRSAKSFKFARLPTAIHVGANVGFDPEKMQEVLERFEGMRGSHFCILGTGRGIVREENLLGIIALRFASANFDHVGLARGGFSEVLEYIRGDVIEYVREAPVSPTQAEKESANTVVPTDEDVSEAPTTTTFSKAIQNIHGRAASIDTDNLKKQANAKADKVKKWGRGFLSSWTAPKEEEAGPASGDEVSPATSSSEKDTKTAERRGSKEKEKEKEKEEEKGEKKASPTEKAGGAMSKLFGKAKQQPQEAVVDAKPAAQPAGKQEAKSKATAFSLVGDDDSEDDFQLVTHPTSAAAAAASPKVTEETAAPSPPDASKDSAKPSPPPKEDDLFSDPVLSLKPDAVPEAAAAAPAATDAPKKKSAADDLFDDDEIFAKKKPDDSPKAAKPAAAAAKVDSKAKADVDIFADDFDINDIELPSDAKKSAKKAATDDFDDLFA